ncbi:DUF4832 domain-containing protein [Flagellimonas algicola]|nr:DUF4832 domain-containing protein [Allomuricauda algicola]
MRLIPKVALFIWLLYSSNMWAQIGESSSQKLVAVYPEESDELLLNPGVGFTTFQRFNGDELNEGTDWTEGFPIEYQDFDGKLETNDYPQTTIAYHRINWRFLETGPGLYDWGIIDKALRIAEQRGQTLMLRVSPYEGGDLKDVPSWYRKLTGEGKSDTLLSKKWRVNPENPEYLKYFGGLIEALGKKYDGHPHLEAVDISFIGYWGEGDGMHLLSDHVRVGLINKYLDNFKKTHLIFQPLNGDAPRPELLVRGTKIAAYWPDGTNNGEGSDMRHLGWRIDCLGDMGFWNDFSHMLDVYPQDIVRSGMKDAWKKAPIAMEICGTFLRWLEKEQYDEEVVNYIFEQALKWHVSTFNAKSSPVPSKWNPLVTEWLKKMGYRFVLRKFTYPSKVGQQGQIIISSWWENKGVAPIYRDYRLAIRLKGKKQTAVLFTSADIRNWLPGDVIFDEKLYVPIDVPPGEYRLELALVGSTDQIPRVKLANKGVNEEGWYPMGKILVTD